MTHAAEPDQHPELRLPGEREAEPVRADRPRSTNLTDSHRLTGTYWWQRFLSTPDLLNSTESTFPGLPAVSSQTSYRTTGSAGLRSTLGTIARQRAEGRLAVVAQLVQRGRVDRHVRRPGRLPAGFPADHRSVRRQPQRAGAAEYGQLEHRRHAQLAQGRAQLLVRRLVPAADTQPARLEPGADADDRASIRPTIRPTRCSTRPTSRARPPRR